MPLPRNKVSSSPLFNYWLNLFSFMVSLLLMVIKWTSTWTRKCRFNSDNVVYMPIANGWSLTARVSKSPKMYWISRSCTFWSRFFWKDLNYHHFSLLLQSQRVYFFWIHEYQTRFYYSIVSTLDILPCQFQLQKGGRLKIRAAVLQMA